MTTEFSTKTVRDKTGADVIIRSVDPERLTDAHDLLELGRAVSHVGLGVTALPEDLPPTVEAEQRFFREFTAPAHNLALVAVVEDRIVGSIISRSPERKKIAHNATVGLMIHPDFQGRGIGRSLLSSLVDWARGNPAITRLRLGVLADNERATALYESLGFTVEGRMVDHVRKPESGQYLDQILMRLDVAAARS